MSRFTKFLFEKKSVAKRFYRWLLFFQLLSRISFWAMACVGFFIFGKSIYTFFLETQKVEDLIKGLFKSFELLFLAPIPFYTVYAFSFIFKNAYPEFFPPNNIGYNTFRFGEAKKIFVTSLIGVSCTVFLDNLIQAGSLIKENSGESVQISIAYFSLLLVFMIFMTLYYWILAKAKEE